MRFWRVLGRLLGVYGWPTWSSIERHERRAWARYRRTLAWWEAEYGRRPRDPKAPPRPMPPPTYYGE